MKAKTYKENQLQSKYIKEPRLFGLVFMRERETIKLCTILPCETTVNK